MERKIGEVFEYNRKKYIVKEVMEGCVGCAFYDNCMEIGSIIGNCARVFRSDNKSIIFVDYKKEKVMENLLNCKGRRFKCSIHGKKVEGRIQVENNKVYLCQNVRNGGDCKDKLGYRFSWSIEEGRDTQLIFNGVTDFKLTPTTAEEIKNYKDWQVGDKIINNCGVTGVIIFRSGELVVFKDNNGNASVNYTIYELYNASWRLDEKPIEESFVEMTMEEIAKLKGIPVEKLRIKDK